MVRPAPRRPALVVAPVRRQPLTLALPTLTSTSSREALAPSGSQTRWTELNAAIAWIAKQHPDQTPRRYGCSSWRQVLHESGEFEVMKKKPAPAPTTGGGTATGTTTGTVVCYRSRREEQR